MLIDAIKLEEICCDACDRAAAASGFHAPKLIHISSKERLLAQKLLLGIEIASQFKTTFKLKTFGAAHV